MNELKSNFKILLRNCLSKIWNKQFLIFLFFLALSSAFWIFQALNEIYEEDFNVKVKMVNVPEGTVITTEAVPEIELYLRDRGVSLINYQYKKIGPLHIDYHKYANASGHVRILTKELLKEVSSQIASSTQITSVKPDTIEFYYNHGLHKRVPVFVEGQAKTGAGYTITGTKLSHDSVTVYASSSLLDDITAAHVHMDYLKPISTTTSFTMKINSIRGAKFVPDTVNYQVNVDRLVEKRMKVAIRTEGFPKDLELLPLPQETNVVFQVPMDLYNSISSQDFVVTAHYKNLPKNGESHYPLQLTSAPKGVSRVRLVPNKVEYVIEKITENDSTKVSEK